MSSFDTRLFLEVNHLAERTAWAHWMFRAYAGYLGLLLLAAIAVWAWWRARGGIFGGGSPLAVAEALFIPLGALLALAIAQPIRHLVGRFPPYAAINQHVEVLVPRSGGFSFPAGAAAVGGAALVAVWLCSDRLLGVLATLVVVLLAFADVYVGAHYPGDVLAGLALGGIVVAATGSLSLAGLRAFTTWAGTTSGLHWAVGAGTAAAAHGPGPAARPEVATSSGAVRILESGAKLVPLVTDPDATRVAHEPAPARPHVRPPGRRLQPARADLRDARESGRRGAAGSAGDL